MQQRERDKLVEQNMGFVVSTARQYVGRGLPLDDLISEGSIGLVKAASKYDSSRGLHFAAFAVVYIRRQIEKALKQESPERRVESRGDGQRRSLDTPLGAKPNVSLLSVLVDGNVPEADQRVYSAAQEQAVEQALGVLDDRQRRVLTAYFGLEDDPLTMQEIAQEMGLRRERVRQIRDQALRRMRKAWKALTA